jgi:hypothetical protein
MLIGPITKVMVLLTWNRLLFGITNIEVRERRLRGTTAECWPLLESRGE